MYAIVKSGGKQHRMMPGQTYKIEKLDADLGQTVDLDQVLLIAQNDQLKVGVPFVKGAKVVAEVVSQGRHKKVHIIKFRRRKHHMKQQGHRQYYTEVKVTDIIA